MTELLSALRGIAWPGDAETPYPRADPADFRLPRDTWATAQLPVGVRLEFLGDARALELDYVCATADLGYRGAGAGACFSAWRGEREVAAAEAKAGAATAVLEFDDAGGSPDRALTVYLPEGLRPTVLAVRAVDGELQPALGEPRWLAYGDSITEGWVASGPAHNWPAIAARIHRLNVCNLGYAGSARGEIASAEQLAALPAGVISIAYGTNCWSRPPHTRALFREGLRAFLATVQQGHAETPIVVVSPILRPEAEQTPNRLGATLGDIRAEVEDVVGSLQRSGADQLHLVRGLPLVQEQHLADGIHPGDEGHRLMAKAIGDIVKRVARPASWARCL